MIRATIRRADLPVVVVEFPDSQDPFAILDRCMVACGRQAVNEPQIAAPRVPAGVRDTSVASYSRLKAEGRLTGQQLKVVEYLTARAPEDATRQEIAQALKLGINAVCGRVKELLDAEEVVETARRECNVTRESAWGVTIKGRLL